MTSTPAAALPPALQRSFDAWAAAGRPADEPTRWSFDHWTAHVPDLPACLECEPLTRAVVTGYAAKVTAEDLAVQRDAFIAAMVWGYGRVGYGPSRVERIMAQPGFEEQLADVTRITLEQGGPAAFEHIRQQRKSGVGCLKHLGAAFGTKYLYFLTKAHRESDIAPVLDSVVRAWFAEHVKDVDVRIGGGWTCPRKYATYVETMQAWGEELKIPADDVERLIFLQQQDSTQEPWRESWSSAAADPEAGELLEALRLALADLGAGDDAEPHLQALEDVIADAEDRAPDEA
ncbi:MULTISPECIES: hypothetical protein [Micrococcus]|uniref:8-oxoguanine DNA glycosylase OGG fold protein n=1 Tax=Micrococcus TaxID=1269 RepID=UPI0011BF57D1|nr:MULTISPECIES: hypothetical protein [Micrococcus]